MSSELIQPGSPAYRRLSIAMVMAGFSTFSLLYSVQPLLPEFSARFGVSAAEASLAVSIATGPMALGILVAAAIADRFGRRPLILVSLILAAVFGLLGAFAPGWSPLLASRCLAGIALAGVPAVAMAYVSEEVEPVAIAPVMGLYIAGSAIGGMIGRLGVALVAEWAGWRAGLGAVGLFSLAAAVLFGTLAPRSRAFTARTHTIASFFGGYRAVAADGVLRLLYLQGFLLMGAFVTLFNYVAFRLAAPPYLLGHAAIGAVFLLYVFGSASSAWFGRLAGRIGVRRAFGWPIALLLLGTLVSAAAPLWVVLGGIAMATIGFFGAHSVASSWVSRRAFDQRAYASALYLFFYYLGSSLLGSVGGFAWTHGGWPGVAVFVGGLTSLALLLSRLLARSVPLSDPRQPRVGQRLPD